MYTTWINHLRLYVNASYFTYHCFGHSSLVLLPLLFFVLRTRRGRATASPVRGLVPASQRADDGGHFLYEVEEAEGLNEDVIAAGGLGFCDLLGAGVGAYGYDGDARTLKPSVPLHVSNMARARQPCKYALGKNSWHEIKGGNAHHLVLASRHPLV